MKTFIIFIVLLFISAKAFSQSGWILQQSGVNETIKGIHFVNENTGWMITTKYILKTTNGGAEWTSTEVQIENAFLYDVFFINENTGWVTGGGCWVIACQIILKTTNGGLNWNNYGGSGSYITSVFFINKMIGFATTRQGMDYGWSSGGILKTTNGNFNQQVNSQYFPYDFYDVKFSGNIGYATARYWDDTSNDTIFIMKSTDLGESWFEVYREANLLQFNFGNLEIAGNKVWCTRQNKLLLSTDEGATWQHVDLGNENHNFFNTFFVNENTGWLCGFFLGDTTNIYKTTNSGSSWFPLSNNYPNSITSLFFVNELTGWAGGSNYPIQNAIILKTITGGVTSITQIGNIIPTEFSLHQNYPNPFNPVTNIKFSLPTTQYTTLIIFDIAGREIATLVNEQLNAGEYSYQFNADEYGLSSGVYFYQLNAGAASTSSVESFVQTRKFVLIK